MKKELLKSISMNIVVLALSLVMLVAMSFAWFLSSVERDAPQTLQVGKFDILLSDDVIAEKEESPRVIAIEAAYPQTEANARTDAANGAIPVYFFEISNLGDIPAQLRLFIQVREDSGYEAKAAGSADVEPLSTQIRYLFRMYLKTDAAPDFSGGGLLFGSDNKNLSFKQFTNGEMLSLNADGSYTGKGLGVLHQDQTLVCELFVWLDENATVVSTGADTSGTPGADLPKLTFTVGVHALQYGGGATFSADKEVADLPEESVPTPIPPVTNPDAPKAARRGKGDR